MVTAVFTSSIEIRSKKKMANFRTLTFIARKRQLEYFVHFFIWYLRAEPGKKHTSSYLSGLFFFFIFLPQHKSPSFITYTHSLWSYFFCIYNHFSCLSYSQSRLVYVLGSCVLLCLFSLESEVFQKSHALTSKTLFYIHIKNTKNLLKNVCKRRHYKTLHVSVTIPWPYSGVVLRS
jgi:hypothetical protein